MKNIHVLPTDKPSRLHSYKGMLNLAASEFVAPTIVKNDLINQNIYITNDEEIKEGDWFITNNNEIFKCIKNKEEQCFYSLNASILTKFCKKIILTTDTDLIKDGIQATDDEFLEWFVKNPSCEVVKIETFEVEDYIGFAGHTSYPTFYNEYKIIIPKEEPKQEKLTYTESARKEERISNCTMMKRKQETVEERELYWDLVDAKAEQNNTIDLDAYAKGVQDGVKWMQERMYSEKEVESLLHKYMQSQIPDWHGWSTTKWFEQFKKK